MKEISLQDLDRYGMSVKSHVMDNDERRFRLINDDGSAYIRTEAPDEDVWQNSHYHTTLQEMYIIQNGWIVFVKYDGGKSVFKKYSAGEYFISEPKVPHNLFVSRNTVFHTVKYGDVSMNDWLPFESLDHLTKHLSVFELSEIIDERIN